MEPTADKAVDRAFEALSKAGMVAFGGVGFAGSTLPETAAFDVVVAEGPAARSRLDRLLTNASPAGKVYAATALSRFDADAGRAAWRRLADDRGDVTIASGCVIDRRPLAEYANEQLGPS